MHLKIAPKTVQKIYKHEQKMRPRMMTKYKKENWKKKMQNANK